MVAQIGLTDKHMDISHWTQSCHSILYYFMHTRKLDYVFSMVVISCLWLLDHDHFMQTSNEWHLNWLKQYNWKRSSAAMNMPLVNFGCVPYFHFLTCDAADNVLKGMNPSGFIITNWNCLSSRILEIVSIFLLNLNSVEHLLMQYAYALCIGT